MQRKYSIVGTGTNVGKTYVTCQILNYLTGLNKKSLGIKPIASGVRNTPLGLINEDVYHLLSHSNVKVTIEQISPFMLTKPIAPHIAAQMQQVELTVSEVIEKTQPTILNTAYDYLLIEGVGGVMVPLNPIELYLDLLVKWNYPLILVVGMELGCINHTLLTYTVLKASGLNVLGWVANCIKKDMPVLEENIDYLQAKLDVPLLGVVPYAGSIRATPAFNEVLQCH